MSDLVNPIISNNHVLEETKGAKNISDLNDICNSTEENVTAGNRASDEKIDEESLSDGEIPPDLDDDTNEEETRNGTKPDGLVGYTYKRVLKNRFVPSSGPLPEGWIETLHTSGFPIYLHKQTRVVTWSRPYALQSSSLKKHDIPMESIPCLHYGNRNSKYKLSLNSKEDLVKNPEQANGALENGEDSSDMQSHPKVTLHDNKTVYISNDDFVGYLEKRFEFETLEIPQFKTWSQRRDFNRNLKRKRMEEMNVSKEVDEGPDEKVAKTTSTNVITLTVEQEDGGSMKKKKYVLNTASKPMICVLHEYTQRVLRAQPQYSFIVREDSAEPFEATIKLNDRVYGVASAINKKTAKNKAALLTLEMLIPGFKGQVEMNTGNPDMKCFKDVSVVDPRVHELSTHTGQLLPYQLLTECLKRHQGVADTNISFDVQQGKKRSLNYTMMCGKYITTGTAKNKKLGKQIAAQEILQQLHPEVKTWLELIKMYGTPVAQERAKRKQEEQEIFDLKQKKTYADDDDDDEKPTSGSSDRPMVEPNPELLAKLRLMMLKTREDQEKRRRIVEEDARLGRERVTPMAAAIAADRGLITSQL